MQPSPFKRTVSNINIIVSTFSCVLMFLYTTTCIYNDTCYWCYIYIFIASLHYNLTKQEAHGTLTRSHDYVCAHYYLIVTKLTTLSTPPGVQGVLSQYCSEVHCANDHIMFNQN